MTDDWLPSEYRVTVRGGPEPNDRVTIVVDHRPTWRRKSATGPRHYARSLAGALREDIDSDLRDVEEGTLPPTFGVFTPEDEREGFVGSR